MHACLEALVDGSTVKLLQESGPSTATVRCHLNAPSRVLIIQQGTIALQHSLIGDLREDLNVFYGIKVDSIFAGCEVTIKATAVLRRAGTSSADATGISFATDGGYTVFYAQLVVPPAIHVVDIAKFPSLPEPEVRQGYVHTGWSMQIGPSVHDAPDVELEEVNSTPSHHHLKYAVKFVQ